MSTVEPERTVVQSQMIAALTERLSLFERFSEAAPSEATAVEDIAEYRRWLKDLAGLSRPEGGLVVPAPEDRKSYESIAELVNFGAMVLVAWARTIEKDPHQMLQGIALGWKPGPALR